MILLREAQIVQFWHGSRHRTAAIHGQTMTLSRAGDREEHTEAHLKISQ
jgi:hypothetical protein